MLHGFERESCNILAFLVLLRLDTIISTLAGLRTQQRRRATLLRGSPNAWWGVGRWSIVTEEKPCFRRDLLATPFDD